MRLVFINLETQFPLCRLDQITLRQTVVRFFFNFVLSVQHVVRYVSASYPGSSYSKCLGTFCYGTV